MPAALLLSITDFQRKQLRNERVKKKYMPTIGHRASTLSPLTKPLAKSWYVVPWILWKYPPPPDCYFYVAAL